MGLPIRFARRLDGVRLAYAVLGSGPPLVWIPGWINHLETLWARSSYRRFFQRLARHRTVLLYDKHGVGLSDRDRTDVTLDADLMDLRTVLDSVEVERATLVGNSQAGAVACALAAAEPERVDRLVLHGAWAHLGEVYPEEVHQAILGMVRGHWGLASELLTDLFVPDADAHDRAWFARFQRDSADAETAVRLLELCYAIDVRPLLGRIRAPTLVLHREGDRVAHRSLGRELAARIPGARYVKLPGRAHFPWEEDADAVLHEMESFLGIAADGPPTHRRPQVEPADDGVVLRREGDVWLVGTTGRESVLKDVKGLRYLAELLRRPDVEAHAVELVATVEGVSATPPPDRDGLDARLGPDVDLGPVADAPALTRYRARLAELRDEVAEAEATNDVDRVAAARSELDAIAEHLAQAVGLGGRDRPSASTAERARVKVTRLLRDAIARIERVDPHLGHLLATSVRTGTYCAYEPPPDGGPRWRF